MSDDRYLVQLMPGGYYDLENDPDWRANKTMNTLNPLDVLIARKIFSLEEGVAFGLCPEHKWAIGNDGQPDPGAWETEEHRGYFCLRCGSRQCALGDCNEYPAEECFSLPKPYSTDLKCAWEITERMPGLMLFQSDSGRWAVAFGGCGPAQDCETDPAFWTGFFNEWYETPALAICHFALREEGVA